MAIHSINNVTISEIFNFFVKEGQYKLANGDMTVIPGKYLTFSFYEGGTVSITPVDDGYVISGACDIPGVMTSTLLVNEEALVADIIRSKASSSMSLCGLVTEAQTWSDDQKPVDGSEEFIRQVKEALESET